MVLRERSQTQRPHTQRVPHSWDGPTQAHPQTQDAGGQGLFSSSEGPREHLGPRVKKSFHCELSLRNKVLSLQQ